MSTHKHFDKICCVVLCLSLVLTFLFVNAEKFGVQKASTVMEYENTLFDTSKVHTINIVMDDWDDFISNCESEEYYNCSVIIDNDAYKNVAIRGKGNTSMTEVKSYGNDRYSFKIEFDHYDSTNTYYGLDKLCLNNIIQDNTYMKDYLCYQMMNKMGVASPLCSYVYITVNGEDWGLYLAVEGLEESFLQRNYGNDYGELYKPDTQKMGGGRGNGKNVSMDEIMKNNKSDSTDTENQDSSSSSQNISKTSTTNTSTDNKSQTDTIKPSQSDNASAKDTIGSDRKNGGQGGFSMSSDDVLLKYIDDDFDSYSNIFDSAKTDITDSDKTRLIESLKKLSNGEDLEDVLDIEAVIKYFVVHNFVLNFDSYTGIIIHNYYLYEKDGKMQMLPWDYNLAFGAFMSGGGATSLVNYPIDSPVSGGNSDDRPMLDWIFDNEEYTALYHQYFSEFISDYFDSGYFSEMMENVEEMISPYVEKDPTKFCTYEEFQKGISTLKEFCLLRAESVTQQLNGTIGSTSGTQDSSTLISAGDIQINDMGSSSKSSGGDTKKKTNTSEISEKSSTSDKKSTSTDEKSNSNTDSKVEKSQDSANSENKTTVPSSDSTDKSSENQSPPELPSSGMPNGEMPSGEVPNGGMPNGEMPNGEMPSGGMPNGEMPNGEMPNGEMPNGEAPNGEMPNGEMPNGEMPNGEAPNGEAPNGESADNNSSIDSNKDNASSDNNKMQKTDNNSTNDEIEKGEKFDHNNNNTMSTEVLILLGVSISILAFGIVFALVYKRRK